MVDQSFIDVLERARRKDPNAQAVLYTQFHSVVSRYIACRVVDDFVEDLVSEVFFQMVKDLHKVKSCNKASFQAWLLRVATYTVAGYYQMKERLPETLSLEYETTDLVSDDDPVRHVEAREEQADLIEALRNLSTAQRQVVLGRFMHGYDTKMLAKQTGKNTNAVRVLQHRALLQLRGNLIARIITILALLGALLGTGYILLKTAPAGSPLHPIKQMIHPSPQGPTPTVSVVAAQPQSTYARRLAVPANTALPTASPTPAVSDTPTTIPTPIVSTWSPSIPAPVLQAAAPVILPVAPIAPPHAQEGKKGLQEKVKSKKYKNLKLH